jgi:hypothetical protein
MDDVRRFPATVEAFCTWIESLPSDELRPKNWGPREVLAHLLYRHEHYLA